MARPTLHQVAAAAGVSIASASRALSGGVASPRTIAKVRAAARELGYFPDATARALRTGAPRRITFAVDDIGNPNYVAMLRAIEAEVGHGGPSVSVTSTGSSDQAVELVRHAATAADGIIISPIRVNDRLRRAITNSPIPVVVIGSLGEDAPVDVVHVDSAKGIGTAVAHVAALGRRNLVFLNGPLDTNPGSSRERGFYRAIRTGGLDPDRCRQVLADDFTVSAARKTAAHLFAGWQRRRAVDRPDAVIAANDLMAIGAMNAATDAGLRIPDDVMFTGVDDTEIAAVYNPSLTSVSLEAAQRGRLAAQLLLERFEEPHRAPHLVSVEPRLVVRRSTTISTAEVLAS
ncbi:LacI family DNA-binding transcriptional regulator [Microbacterium elymi]|uniref:LacI family transcriptional regulator n=1 Tax=Microbacterium elymi TaxID=2909587 RepID=A0ABY5NHJ4_9MICO|nr:LacI family DNA-binding transcriptional regulator [Microbacterium elymi]UUT34623.1 LacI family transcriptional regulator [Microbacterium elymi]